MKNHIKALLTGIIVLSSLSPGVFARRNYSKTSIVVSESVSIYEVSALYDSYRTGKLMRYINDSLKPDLIFKYKERLDEQVTLKDKTTFYMYFLPGKMNIKLIKSENSEASLLKIKKMCAGLNSVLNH